MVDDDVDDDSEELFHKRYRSNTSPIRNLLQYMSKNLESKSMQLYHKPNNPGAGYTWESCLMSKELCREKRRAGCYKIRQLCLMSKELYNKKPWEFPLSTIYSYFRIKEFDTAEEVMRKDLQREISKMHERHKERWQLFAKTPPSKLKASISEQ